MKVQLFYLSLYIGLYQRFIRWNRTNAAFWKVFSAQVASFYLFIHIVFPAIILGIALYDLFHAIGFFITPVIVSSLIFISFAVKIFVLGRWKCKDLYKSSHGSKRNLFRANLGVICLILIFMGYLNIR